MAKKKDSFYSGRAANEFDVCPGCGITYADFRLPPEINFSTVQSEFWSDSDDYREWYFKSRHTFLGRLHEYKLRHWAEHREQCEDYAKHGRVRPAWERAGYDEPGPGEEDTSFNFWEFDVKAGEGEDFDY